MITECKILYLLSDSFNINLYSIDAGLFNSQAFELDLSLPYSTQQQFMLMKPLVSRFIRLKPEKLIDQDFVCMKIEIIGCKKYGMFIKKNIKVSVNITLMYT